ncbi:hypothetical protein SARC_14825 [Sphaeroforma arctica JP610]|uniref:Uncharacterized protein n=1 Tax=Sphaeroforma arctica JP610 TaxID=667725 RepID=A0A0L0F7C9_9EUKA|nr:hypothetical protein SARC_14825 [Sphaeroforma arctica JP610]KNC72615.1 hypothetical protein SARC_14825 [Sphaeroforma arctica JP610]|eukprot:XP_014146517.1 hypothetical protein SARC_14825 [Sphaeroforma arctica JP610]
MDVEKILARASQICHEVRNSSDAAGLTDLFEVPHRKESIGLMRRASVPE